MNNEQFRRLVSSANSNLPKNDDSQRPKAVKQVAGTPSVLPRLGMAPRTVKSTANSIFSRDTTSQTSQFRTAAPKGSKLARGYRDRTKERQDDESDDTSQRIKALEKQLKEGHIDETTFKQLSGEITGGRLEHTHLVKGLDWKLLERIRKGEDVTASKGNTEEAPRPKDIDDEFDELEKTEVVAVAKEETVKKGEMAPPPKPSVKKTRNEILAELKASRKRAAESTAPSEQLGSKFRRIGEKRESSRLEVDKDGREVLVITDADGNVKRKVRKTQTADSGPGRLLAPDQDAKPLGSDVAVVQPVAEEDSDSDIYSNAGDDYDPLADLGVSDDSSSDESAGSPGSASKTAKRPKDIKHTASTDVVVDPVTMKEIPEQTAPPSQPFPRNYFNEDPSTLSVLKNVVNPLKDPTVLAALAQRSRGMDAESKEPTSDEERLKRRAEMLSTRDRDMEDLDMGFGGNRFDDAEEMAMEGSKVKLSEWKDGPSGSKGKKGGGKKNKPAKRKAEKYSADQVLRVMEDRLT